MQTPTPNDGPQKNVPNIEQSSHIEHVENNIRNCLEIIEKQLRPFSTSLEQPKSYQFVTNCLEQHLPNLYSQYDQYIQAHIANLEEPVTCAQGCSHCCSHYVASVEPFELLYIEKQIRNSPHYGMYMMALHKRHSQFSHLATPLQPEKEDSYLHQYFLKNIPCPFLTKTKSCGIYDVRPFSCRMYLSLSTPVYCKGKLITSPQNKNFIVELPDDIEVQISQISLLFKSLDIPPFLFPGLLRINELYGAM